MHNCKLQLLLLFYSLLSVSFQNDCALKSVHFIPFIIRMVTGPGDCWGVVVSSTVLLVNEGCINQATYPSSIYLITHNTPPSDIVTVPSFTLNTDLNKFLPAHFENDWALFGLPSPLKFTQFLKAARFPLKTSPKNNYFLVVFKSGRLALSPIQLQEDHHCRKVYGEDFDTTLHYCILEPDSPYDDLLTSVKDSVAHLMLNEKNTVVGLVLPRTIKSRLGKVYRVLKIAPVVNWIKSHTTLTYDTNSSWQENFFCNPFTRNTATQLIENLVRETLQDMREELSWLLLKNVTELQRNLHEAKTFINQELDARFKGVQKYVEKKGRDIMWNIEENHVTLLKSMSEKDDFLKKTIDEKISDVEKAIQEKDSQIKALEYERTYGHGHYVYYYPN